MHYDIGYDVFSPYNDLKYIIIDELSTEIESSPLQMDAILVSNTRCEGALRLEPK